MKINAILGVIILLMYLYISDLKASLDKAKTKAFELNAVILAKDDELKRANLARDELNKKLQDKQKIRLSVVKKVSENEKSKDKLDDYFLDIFNSLQ
ncbi:MULTISPECIES: hypothetical protein [unclassified Campylobacter]|uniref:hypothetical protein n=1 Tax=unclassified Campylobacter TaxID=2593542 RepID=UPI001D323466|nr:hypothetical protein [Campylobacter sp. RM12637]MBZ7983615.1 hypothetical protein [Campylobacter sp. RM12647]MBZ7993776.1 hypothetical protein [Campylobacter sp. RM9333]